MTINAVGRATDDELIAADVADGGTETAARGYVAALRGHPPAK
ncbi:hypothetical protein [Leifsonia sp. Leaf264]|nr:hypothetical protein [Leifsonia sp. Leaf264]